MRVLASLLALGAALFLAAACGSETDDREPTFTYLYAAIIEPSCTTVACHSASAETFGIALDDREDAYELLVGAPCVEGEPPTAPRRNYVRPGDPERSRLVNLLEGVDVPRRMPPDSPLPSQDVELVRQWILSDARCD